LTDQKRKRATKMAQICQRPKGLSPPRKKRIPPINSQEKKGPPNSKPVKKKPLLKLGIYAAGGKTKKNVIAHCRKKKKKEIEKTNFCSGIRIVFCSQSTKAKTRDGRKKLGVGGEKRERTRAFSNLREGRKR